MDTRWFTGSGSGANPERAFAFTVVTITSFSALGANNDSVTISTTPATLSIQTWTHGSSNNAMATNLGAAINVQSQANGNPVVATVSGPAIRIVSTAAGTDGNTYNVSTASTGWCSVPQTGQFFSGGA